MNATFIDKLLEDLSGRYAEPYTSAIQDLFAAVVSGNKPAALDAREALARAATETMGIGEILGARLTLEGASRVAEKIGFYRDPQSIIAFQDQAIVPAVTFEEALEDMVSRTPKTMRRAAERSAQRIAELYGSKRVIAFARSAEAIVTREAQKYIADAMRTGMVEGEAAKAIAMRVNEVRKRSKEWSEAYARMVFRTNVNTAVTAGRFRQAQDPDVKAVVPALRFDAIGDGDTRKNHNAADGVILRSDNPAWAKLAPPLGYNCRCQVSLVSVPELRALGRIDKRGNIVESKIPPAAKPDDGFRHGGRPDITLAGR